MRPKWTKNWPAVGGFYFFRDQINTSRLTTIVRAREVQDGELAIFDMSERAIVRTRSAEFSGPIPEPED